MRELSVAFDADTLATLERERRQLGFESRSAYVRWLVGRRDELEDGEPGRSLSAETEREDGADVTERGVTTRATESSSATETELETLEPAASLVPDRVVRVSEDGVGADAAVLETVQIDRLDAFSRRAVAQTRDRLDRTVETGLSYRSATDLDGETPGADLVDLESLSVPGRSENRREQRRAVAGRAVAFLRDEGRARKATVVEALYDAHPAGYETADGWWRFLKGVFDQVDAIEGGAGSRVWQYAGRPNGKMPEVK
ncbi:hypothetical protein [Natronococcus occultus]|uniref:Uncharacterized protein n=1 Tax=Natronococcus occultus SP4 TaxID=694430 RepID=L0JX43_9EURY|nr:hypothetical protein [Natronococcus occultus]AGB36689.1 hypothetical protein Natoc_0834 [Natronococcus occultus SP4]